MAPEVIPFPMQHISGRDERLGLVGDPDGRPESSLSPDECSLPTPQRQSAAVTGQAPTAMFENAKNIIINGGQFTQTFLIPNPSDSISDVKPKHVTTPPALRSHYISDLYQRNMASVRAGTALWIPEGHSNFGNSYQDRGVSIGDVGTLTSSGSFSFLFNICLPADHPVNNNLVPEGFQPIYPEIHPCDIREIHEFMPLDYLSTDSIMTLAKDSDDSTPNARLISFQAQGDGAVAVMPEGAISQDLENISKFRFYAASHLKQWYHYVNVTRGREIGNGELRLVIGCDKTTSWAIAAVQARQSDATTIHLHEKRKLSSQPYSWRVSGSVNSRTGPRCPRYPQGAADNALQKLNQCLFVRTMNLKLGTNEWCALVDSSHVSVQELRETSPPRLMQARSMGHYREDHSTPFRHASDLLHNIMLSLYPEAKMAITEDDEVLQHHIIELEPNDLNWTPSYNGLAARLKELYEVKYDGFVVYLEKKQNSDSEDQT